MKKDMNYNNSKVQRINLLLFVLMDVVLINLAAFMALFIRHEFSYTALARTEYLQAIFATALPGTIAALCAFFVFHVYSIMWEFASDRELTDVAIASVVAAALYMIASLVMGYHLPRSFPFIFAMVLFLLVTASRMLFRIIAGKLHGMNILSLKEQKNRKRTMLIGAGAGSSMAIKEFSDSENSRNNVVCIIDDDKSKHGRRIRGVKVIGGRECIDEAVKKYDIEEIVFCIPSAPPHIRKELLEICSSTGAKLKTLPALAQLANEEVSVSQLRDVSIDDLLGRTQVKIDNSVIEHEIRGNTVLVTGGGGSIGSELCRQIAALSPERLIIFDIYENNAYDIQQELKRSCPELDLIVLIGSVRDADRVNYIFDTYRPAVVCHAAAHKHVPLMEDSPAEAIKNNIFGTYNVAKAAGEYNTALFILISTDKAVNPTNVMGASKRMCEMVVQSMNGTNNTRYTAVRFGNVLGSNGSVIPLFKKQIEEGGPVTVTDKRVTRFFMTIPEAVSLILQAGAYAKGGEVFVLDMGSPVRIDSMARKMIRLCGLEPDVDIKIEYTGLRPGEKLYEELLLKAEGLQKTENDLIYVGHQMQYTKAEIEEKLDTLRGVIKAPNRDVRECMLSLIQEAEDDSYSPIFFDQEEDLAATTI